ncbi:family 20 glycosylhydrolase [Lactococcus fujiensis]|nr:family 20 glycosylhydrolase [Lactococcus fujiensis]
MQELGLLLDIGRKYWSLDEIKSLMLIMNKAKMTHLQLHFSENLGFRLELPTLKLDPSENRFTKTEVAEILNFASELDLEVIPDFDAPGHLDTLLKNYPQYILPETSNSALDVTNDEAIQWLFGIYDEILDWFPNCKSIHIGGDEFIDFRNIQHYPYLLRKSREKFGPNASGIEFYVAFINQLTRHLKLKGLDVRIWNDGLLRSDLTSLVNLNPTVEVTYWTNWDPSMANVSTWLEAGYTLINFCDNDLYYVLGNNAGYIIPTVDRLKHEAKKNKFSGGQYLNANEMAQVKGTYFSVWADLPNMKTCEEILYDLDSLLPTFYEIYH